MQQRISKNTISSPEIAIRRCGYGMVIDRNGGVKSYVKRLDRDLFPRFHLYIDDKDSEWQLNLHLDQRAPVYAGTTAHAGEYDGEVVEREMERIKNLLEKQV